MRLHLDDAGAALAPTSYSPFGTPTVGSPEPFGFTGEMHLGGLQYLRARWYDPAAGVFVGRDPFEGFDTMPYSLHYYQYGYSDPVRFTDPSGMVPDYSASVHYELSMLFESGNEVPGSNASVCRGQGGENTGAFFGRSRCDEMIDHIRTFVNAMKPSQEDGLWYRILFGRSQWADSIVFGLSERYAGLNKRNMMSFLNSNSLIDLWSVWANKQDIEKYRFQVDWETDQLLQDLSMSRTELEREHGINAKEWSAGEGECADGITGHCPSPNNRLEYGFRQPYWGNPHHFFAFFYIGYALGSAGHMASVTHELMQGSNVIDIAVGSQGIHFGSKLRAGGMHPNSLASALQREMCLSEQERGDLLAKALTL